MKLRVRVNKQTSRLELDEEQPTLGDLRRKLSESFLPSLGYSAETVFTITLNGKDPLTEEQDTLESYGIIPGDLIVVLLPESLIPDAFAPQPPPPLGNKQDVPSAPEIQSESTGTLSKSQTSQIHNVCLGAQSTCEAGASSSTTSSEMDVSSEDLMDADVAKSPWEPMLCNEALNGQIPHALETLYHTAGCICSNDALMVVIHLLMLETGYLQQGADTKILRMPDEWRNSGFYKLLYSHPLCNEGSATLACVPMGKFIIINASMKINEELKSMKRLQLSTDSYISFPAQDDDVATVYKDLQKLSRQFKDHLVYPLLAATRQVLNLPDVFGLVVLPLELKLRIFRLLDVRSLCSLSASCRDLWAAIGDPSLWRFLYMRDFHDQSPRSRDSDWKELYQKKHKQKREIFRRHLFSVSPPPHPFPFHPIPFFRDPFASNPTYPPGIIGGEYDQRPILPIVGDPISSLISGTGPTPGRFLPFRPRFDPIGPLPDTNPMLPGRNTARPSRGRAHDIRRGFI